MKILILNRDYPRFLADMYRSNPALTEASYAEQLTARNSSLFGVADFYSHGFAACGHSARDIHVNNLWLQSAWARENGLEVQGAGPLSSPGRALDSRWSVAIGLARRMLQPLARRFLPRQIGRDEEMILAAQIEQLDPDIILNQEMSYIRTRCLNRIVKRRTKIVGQIASALPIGESFRRYDLIISSLPNLVRHFEAAGSRAALSRLAFDPRVLEQVPQPAERDVSVSFVGSVSADHGARLRLLEALARRLPLKVWGNGVEQLPRSSPIRECFQGEAWGAQMYGVLRRSQISINHHIDLADGYSNNMRLYEATGCGALMVVDRGRNLPELFTPDKEVITYASTEECLEAVERMLSDRAGCAAIAAAGQRRTLSEHTYARRTRELSDLLSDL
jgi:spore maturation protein CgeB